MSIGLPVLPVLPVPGRQGNDAGDKSFFNPLGKNAESAAGVAGVALGLAGNQAVDAAEPTFESEAGALEKRPESRTVSSSSTPRPASLSPCTYMTVIVAFELSRFCASLSRFTLEVFEAFVCSVTFWLRFQRIIKLFYTERSEEFLFGDALFSLMLSGITFFFGMILSSIGTAKVLTPRTRSLLADYGVVLTYSITPYTVQYCVCFVLGRSQRLARLAS